MIFIYRSITGVDQIKVRFIDTGDVEFRHEFELYKIHNQFNDFPNQAYHLHLVGVIPADEEDDWDPRICERIQKHLTDFFKSEEDLIYEGIILFSLRNTIVVNIMRLINHKHGVVHCPVKYFLQSRGFGNISRNCSKKVLEMAKKEGKTHFTIQIILLNHEH